ncbi:MAG: hypothetical protein ACO3JL_12535 [Myxococcota bacterium]
MHIAPVRRYTVLEELQLYWHGSVARGLALPGEPVDIRSSSQPMDARDVETRRSGDERGLWVTAAQRAERTKRLLQCLRALRPLDTVNLHVTLDETVSANGLDVNPGLSDPRFVPGASTADCLRLGTDDLRYAAVRWRARLHGLPDDYAPTVFSALLALEEGRFDSLDAWFDLSHEGWRHELEERAEGLYDLDHISIDRAEIDDVMAHMWDAARTEHRHRLPVMSLCPWCETASTPFFTCASCEVETLSQLYAWGDEQSPVLDAGP